MKRVDTNRGILLFKLLVFACFEAACFPFQPGDSHQGSLDVR
jgi:hypothetical protein